MEELSHPSELNALQRYRAIKRLAKSSSRLNNPDWYKSALDLNVQVHMYWGDDSGVDCFLYIKSSGFYEKLDKLNQSQLEKKSDLESLIDSILGRNDVKSDASIGFILYLGDDISLAGLGPEYQNPADLNDLAQLIIESPTEVLEDKTVSTESHSWRLFPYSGAAAGSEFATAVAIPRGMDKTLFILREIGRDKNIPISTCGLSAPLCALASLPLFVEKNEQGSLTVFNYKNFTLLGVFNAHYDLMMLRYLPHPNGAAQPANLGAAALSTAIAFELENPEVNVLSMADNNPEAIVVSLQSSLAASDINVIDSKEVITARSIPEEIPFALLATTQELDAEICPLVENATFSSLAEDGWHLQDFLTPSQDELDYLPSAQDVKLIKTSANLKKIAALLFVGALAYFGLNTFTKMRNPAWSYKKENTQAEAQVLMGHVNQYNRWDNFLKDRSKAWVTLELISRLTPADGSVLLKDTKHFVGRQTAPGVPRYGLKKEWIINGYCNNEALQKIETMGTREGISKIFAEVAEVTGNEAFYPYRKSRDLTVKMERKRNPVFNSLNPSSPYEAMQHSIRMTITQVIRPSDELALTNVKSVPKKK